MGLPFLSPKKIRQTSRATSKIATLVLRVAFTFERISMLSSRISDTIVLSLASDWKRREYIRGHFNSIGINNFSFFLATEHTSQAVADAYKQGKVKQFPSCFRCGKESCSCENNILIPQQVANWLSFISIWRSLKDKSGYFLICEDDVALHRNAIECLNPVIEQLPSENEMVLLRLVASGNEPNQTMDISQPLTLIDQPVMSNAAYIVSAPMVNYLLESLDVIEHTSDVWLHQQIATHPRVKSFTVEPLIGTDLSFNPTYAQFMSQIHPKGINDLDTHRKKQHVKRVTSITDYKQLLNSWLKKSAPQNNRANIKTFSELRDKQIELIKAISPQTISRKYQGEMNALYEREYGFSRSFEEWDSCDADGSPIPWMTYPSIYYLSQLDFSDANIFEWGCGSSSLFFAKRCRSLISVESNLDWYDHVAKQQLANQTLLLKSAEDYAISILDNDEDFDVISVDGDIFRRLECAYHSLGKLKPGGLLIIDNSDWLEHTCAFLRELGYTQIDFAGPGPINNYMWCTSIFFKGYIALPNVNARRPSQLKTGINNHRDIDLPKSLLAEIKELENIEKSRRFPFNYAHFKRDFLPNEVDTFSAQEGEDALIRRILKWHYNKVGFYVDVGSHHPTRFSNTYHYYLKGWNGVNIDPRPNSKMLFDKIRPRDINLECGVANLEGELTYYQFQEPAFNTFSAEAVEYAKTRTELTDETKVPVRPLRRILAEHIPQHKEITFLNIDVEGFELSVLQSSDWGVYRPKVVCVEALDEESLVQLSTFMTQQTYLRIASTKNSYFFCEKEFWEEVK